MGHTHERLCIGLSFCPSYKTLKGLDIQHSLQQADTQNGPRSEEAYFRALPFTSMVFL